MADEYITIRWAGDEHRVRVLRRYKNGKIRVERILPWQGGRPGTINIATMSVEPWQVVD